jgi:hypothetical protein
MDTKTHPCVYDGFLQERPIKDIDDLFTGMQVFYRTYRTGASIFKIGDINAYSGVAMLCTNEGREIDSIDESVISRLTELVVSVPRYGDPEINGRLTFKGCVEHVLAYEFWENNISAIGTYGSYVTVLSL